MYQTNLHCKITPGAKRGNTIVYHGQQQDHTLHISVSDTAIEGKANRAVVKTLAKILHLPASQISVVQGKKSRNKTIQVVSHTMDENQIHQKLQHYS